MRQGHQFNNNNKQRMRGRNRKGPNPLTRSYESNGGDVKIRGTAIHIAEKYVQLARDAQASGDRVAAENYLQHAEHYYRIVAAAQAQMPQPQPVIRNDEEGDEDEDRAGDQQGNGYGDRQPFPQQGEPAMGGQSDQQQPYFNGGNGQGGGDGRQGNQQGGDNRPYQGRDHRDRDDQGGGYRGRRRRFYRDRYDRGGNEQGPSDNPPQQGSAGGGDVDAPQGDE